MREDVYGPKLQQTIEAATEPMTAHQLTKAVGCSRQRTYVWLATGARDVIEVGRNTRGAAMFKHVPGTRRPKRAAAPTGTAVATVAGNVASGVVHPATERPASTKAWAALTGGPAGEIGVGVMLRVVDVRWSAELGLVTILENADGAQVTATILQPST